VKTELNNFCKWATVGYDQKEGKIANGWTNTNTILAMRLDATGERTLITQC
jgi:hypothetical protein